MANDDKIYEAYIGKRGEESKNNTHNRIEWIIDNIKDSKEIIDIGCSQGIISLLMAREGKNVKAIDIQEEAIDFANNLLNKEFYDVREKITFECIDFNEYKEKKVYDTVVITEVIEHLEDPVKFIKHIDEFVYNEGKVIITVPFGVCNHPDHKSTFYLSNIIDIIEKSFEVEDIKYMGKWVGFVAKKYKGPNKFIYNRDVVSQLEKNFFQVDSLMNNKIEELYNYNNKANEKYRNSIEIYSKLKERYNNDIKNIKAQYMSSDSNYKKLEDEYNECLRIKEKYKKEKEELSNIVENFVNDFEDEIIMLKENKALIHKLETQNNYLKHENNEYRRKLSLITDTFIGKIGIKIYKTLKRLKARIK
ncbi:methyltransferase domain-containing protein [Clostridium botulinum]|uniref:class I SAM-dependent methyltransferase n=1 Tax=unclassified Clostridium TaxID=2614128 RepID=UPI0005012C59|nr:MULTISPECIES: methyltransferase domain-containing protein [unclassified Clostridium]AIY79866.1 methyltransferase domain protein [Clostridium botulinum 202F]KAI3347505.1 methyltransferase domain-containing protein [Clostridium botulinum]KFX56725.1 hypothetical protein KU41_09830 [Clostridium botulinum]KFX59697.1 hypothetical protein KU40_01540 [Clostridium botulinum]KON14265.1 hypothetical protein ACP50_01775 [Clostridium botulinum]